MPTASERVINRPLSGTEFQEVLRDAFEKLLANEGLLSPHIAYGRVGFSIRLALHLDNPLQPESASRVESRGPATNNRDPRLEAVEPAPLTDASPEALIVGSEIEGRVESPNEDRLRLGLPIPVDRKEQDGTLVTELVKYPAQPDLGKTTTEIRDTTVAQKKEWGR